MTTPKITQADIQKVLGVEPDPIADAYYNGFINMDKAVREKLSFHQIRQIFEHMTKPAIAEATSELEAENARLREGINTIANIACRAVGGKTEDYICSRNLQSDIQKEVNRINELLENHTND